MFVYCVCCSYIWININTTFYSDKTMVSEGFLNNSISIHSCRFVLCTSVHYLTKHHWKAHVCIRVWKGSEGGKGKNYRKNSCFGKFVKTEIHAVRVVANSGQFAANLCESPYPQHRLSCLDFRKGVSNWISSVWVWDVKLIFEIKGIVGGPNFCREYIILIYRNRTPEFLIISSMSGIIFMVLS